MDDKKLALRFFPSLSDFAFLAPAIMLFGVMFGTRSLLADSDTGWHIRAGDWILDHGRFPTSDFFSFTKPGQPWYAWEWLWEVAFAWLHRHGGMAGVIFVCALVICLTGMLLFRLIRAQSSNDLVAFAVTLVAMFGMAVHFLARPHLFSALFAVILLTMVERKRRAGRDVPWGAIPLLVLWVNVHPGFAAGIIILCAYTAGELVAALTSPKPEERKFLLKRFERYALLTVACSLAPLANPYGYRLFVHMYAFLSDPYVLSHVTEYMVVDFRIPPGRAFEAMLIAGVPAALAQARKRQFAPLFLYLGWAHLALTSQRNIPFFMIAVAGPVALWVDQLIGAAARSPLPEWIRKGAGAFERFGTEFSADDRVPRFHLISIGAMALVWLLLHAPGAPPGFRPKYDRAVYPEAALTRVRQLGPTARIFSTDVWGGYLIYQLYPDVRVFWDGRTDFYGTPYNQAAGDAMWGRPGWEKTLAKSQITAALLPVNQPLTAILDVSKDWQEVYRDKTSVLFQAVPGANHASSQSSRIACPAYFSAFNSAAESHGCFSLALAGLAGPSASAQAGRLPELAASMR